MPLANLVSEEANDLFNLLRANSPRCSFLIEINRKLRIPFVSFLLHVSVGTRIAHSRQSAFKSDRHRYIARNLPLVLKHLFLLLDEIHDCLLALTVIVSV